MPKGREVQSWVDDGGSSSESPVLRLVRERLCTSCTWPVAKGNFQFV